MYCPTENTDGDLRLSDPFFESAARPAAYAPAAGRGPRPAVPVERTPGSAALLGGVALLGLMRRRR